MSEAALDRISSESTGLARRSRRVCQIVIEQKLLLIENELLPTVQSLLHVENGLLHTEQRLLHVEH